jgi:hypothetical protein|tara:strand:- start:11668 stop:11946 length:279 start_codon:yes stop_codon:yes gene_type:complete
MTKHDKLELAQAMNYCAGELKTGCDHKSEECVCAPIIITDFSTKKRTRKTTRMWKLNLYDKDGNPVQLVCKFGNTKGRIKASGARVMLEVRK